VEELGEYSIATSGSVAENPPRILNPDPHPSSDLW
jgi:hypothetical protein